MRGGFEDSSQSRRLLSELLLQMTYNKQIQQQLQERKLHDSSYKSNSNGNSTNVVVIAATNRIEDLDEAILRRFESKIYV